MVVAIVGSRGITVSGSFLSQVLPPACSCIVSGGARGVDQCAAVFARAQGIPLREFLPDYKSFGRRAPLVRDDELIAVADLVLAFWDKQSRGTAYTVRQARRAGVPVRVFVPSWLV